MKTYVFTNRVYPPVGGATGELLKELAEGLATGGDRILVVTSRGQGQETPKRETINGVEVIRVGTAPFTRASHWRRALSYVGLYPQFAWQVWKLGAVDAVVSMTDPPLQVAAVTLAACRAKKKIHWAQDVYPELAEELGVLRKGSAFAGILRAVSTLALRRQDEIVAVGRCMRDRLLQRGIDAGKIEVIPNWSSVTPVSDKQVKSLRDRLGWSGKFIVLYSGNIGLAHDFETLVGAAKLLEGGGVWMVFAGEGPRLDELKMATQGVAHVAFLPPQAKKDLSAFIAAADVHLVSVRAGLEGLVVPSKAYGILAAGRPILYVGGADSEIAEVIAETGCGAVIPNGDAAGLAAAMAKAASKGMQFQSTQTAVFAEALTSWRKLLA
jgi:glycosyltransferase involved in cell wall biosynthesis